MIVYVATKNAGKFAELQAIFAGSGWQLRQHPQYEDVAEGDTSYAENAALKASALFAFLRARGEASTVLGDDSGLEIDALDGRPGVRSARYGGENLTWSERRRGLLAEIAATGKADRSARFVCALHVVTAEGRHWAVQRTLAGAIASDERGVSGFSYDPLFVYEPLGLTFGEMDDAAKVRVSHRALAARALLRAIELDGVDSPDILTHTGNGAPTGT